MSNGYSGVSTCVITEENLAKLELPAYTEFQQLFEDNYLDMEDFASNEEYFLAEVEDEKVKADLIKTIQRLYDQFKDKTGLSLYINYHNSLDNGSNYDEVDGIFWEVGGVFKRTEAAIANENIIDEVNYVTFG